jgi:hypothetical protein
MIKLMIHARPNPKDARKFLFFHAQKRDNKEARPLRRARGQSRFDPNGKKKVPPCFALTALPATAAPEGDKVSVAVEVTPLARFNVEGCNEQE